MALCFHTDTIIPREALTLLGATTKADDQNKIGFYGTGFKYAIAVLMRENIEFGIRVAGDDYQFTTVERHLHDTKYDVIVIDGKETSLTTRMGVEWEVWQAIREVWQNTVDESGTIHFGFDVDDFYTGSTFWIDDTDLRVNAVIESWSDYFIQPTEQGPIDKKKIGPCRMYKLGMRVSPDDSQDSLFDYGLTKYTHLNEMRMVDKSAMQYHVKNNSSEFTVDQWREILTHENREDMLEWTAFKHGHYERNDNLMIALMDYRIYPNDYDDVVYNDPPPMMIPNLWYDNLMALYSNELNFATAKQVFEVELCEGCQIKIEGIAYVIWRATKFRIPYTMKLVKFADEHCMGMVRSDDDEIFISHHLPHENHDLQMFATILEEMLHLHTGVEDCSREMQEILLKMAAKGVMSGLKFVDQTVPVRFSDVMGNVS